MYSTMRDEFLKGFSWCEIPKVSANKRQFDELLDKDGPVERIINAARKASDESNATPLITKDQINERTKSFLVFIYNYLLLGKA